MSDDNIKTTTPLGGEPEQEKKQQPFSYKNLSRRAFRSLIFHYLYAMENFDYDNSLESIVDNFNRGFELNVPLDSEAVKTAQSIIDDRDKLDEEIKPLLNNWRFDRIGLCTKLFLRMALWELANTDIDSTVIINEAIELAKCFAEKDAYKFINGILDEKVKSSAASDKED